MTKEKANDQATVEEVKLDDVGALALTGSADEAIDPNGPEARSVLRKIDWHILPIIMIASVIQFLDKTSVSHAALWGMNKEANLTGNQYPWLTTIFYMGYLLSEFPTNYLFQKIHLTKVCGVCIVLWGLVLMSTALAKDFAGLMVARFFLGVLEASISPCMALVTTMFYRKSEQPFRSSLWWSMNSMGIALGGLVGYGIGHIHTSVSAWKFPFIILGAVTVVWGFVWLAFVPANPTEARWLSPREKVVGRRRTLGPQLFIEHEKPRYPTAFWTQLGCFSAQFVIAGILFFRYKRENARRDAAPNTPSSDGGGLARGLSDLTDKENQHFRYEL